MLLVVIPKNQKIIHNVKAMYRRPGSKTILGFSDFLYGFKQLCDMAPDGEYIVDCFIAEVHNDGPHKDDTVILDTVNIEDCVCLHEVTVVMPDVLLVDTHILHSGVAPLFSVCFTMDWNGYPYDATGKRATGPGLVDWLRKNKRLCAEDYMSYMDVMHACSDAYVGDCKRAFSQLGFKYEDAYNITYGEIQQRVSDSNILYFNKKTHPKLCMDYPHPIEYRAHVFSTTEAALNLQSLNHPIWYYDDSDEDVKIACETKQAADWHVRRERVLEEILTKQFEDPELMKELRATGDRCLVYNTTPKHDNIYGQCVCPECYCRVGDNLLGRILMRIRHKEE